MDAGDVRDGRGAHGRVEVFRVDDTIVPADDEKMVVFVHVGEVGHVLHRQRRVLRKVTNCLCGLLKEAAAIAICNAPWCAPLTQDTY
jgi:hypothetical protein